ncbi:uncharacterized protein LOC130647974 isoform X1 [Hydractinia symbiolongicarpus]|uniref:uncharacterized protein LOC130647974 isoform X1 n=1 Tax=Hydractinia symbiolongicarpus TaxID=13093 RepID=UPI00254D7E21|nr:uncharacterized protein LOC130647974 isoform X1 [Hydractinia symbiolongicarpus]
MRNEYKCVTITSSDYTNKSKVCEPGSSPTKKRCRGKEFMKNSAARSDCRYKRRNGILNSVSLLKLCTGDDVMIQFLHGTTKEKKVFGTCQGMLLEQYLNKNTDTCNGPMTSTALQGHVTTLSDQSMLSLQPSTPQHTLQNLDAALNALTPSAPIETASTDIDENTCQLCRAKHDTEDDLDSAWIGCSARGCKYWVHALCLGFTCKKVENFGNFWCLTHIKRHVTSTRRKLKH